MIKIEAVTLEEAYRKASLKLECSVTELKTEVVQHPSSGFMGLFKKNAIIVATCEIMVKEAETKVEKVEVNPNDTRKKEQAKEIVKEAKEIKSAVKKELKKDMSSKHSVINDTIMPTSFVSDQDEDDLDISDFTADYDDKFDEKDDSSKNQEIINEIKTDINALFDLTCFNIDEIKVKFYDETTLLVEFRGADAALLIGKEGYRYKALSYMIFNWVNSKYKLQLRLEIAEFLKNQEETVARYLDSVKESVQKDGRAQTKILDGVLIQIALKELRDIYPDKYVVIRSTRDGLKYIIINDYHSN